MRSKKRWMNWFLIEATDMRIKMPWEQNTRPIAFANLNTETAGTKAA